MSYPKPCGDCKRVMRPYTSTPDDYPTAEAVHSARGLCKTCYSRRWVAHREAHPVTLTPELEKIRHETNVRGLQRFLRRIRGKSRV